MGEDGISTHSEVFLPIKHQPRRVTNLVAKYS
jgi:hypothetical protein